MTPETLPAMRARHAREIRQLIQSQADARVTQVVAARRLGTTRTNINVLVQRLGIFWPVKRQGVKTQ